MTATKTSLHKLFGEINQYLNHNYLYIDHLNHYLTLKSIVHSTTYVMILMFAINISSNINNLILHKHFKLLINCFDPGK